MTTTNASVARNLGLWVLYILGQLKYREDSPNGANPPRLAVEWVGATASGTSVLADTFDNFFARTLAIIGRDGRMIQPNPFAPSTLIVVSPPSPAHTTPAARVSPMSVLLAFDFRTLAGAAARALWRDRSQGKPSAGSDGKIEITLPDGSHLQVGNDVSLAALRRVMTVLRG